MEIERERERERERDIEIESNCVTVAGIASLYATYPVI